MLEILFALPRYEALARQIEALDGVETGRFAVSRFDNEELYLVLSTAVAGQYASILGSLAPPDLQMLSVLLLSHTLRKEGASKVTALLPYLGYARQDREEAGRSLGAAWVGQMLSACGIDEVVTVDIHNASVQRHFPIPLYSLSPAALFAEAIRRQGLQESTLVAPDAGALERCEAVRQAAGISAPVAHLDKVRTPEGVRHSVVHGQVSRQAIVVDDILDTGGTLVSCCESLQRAGAQEIIVMVTHGLFTGAAWERLWSVGVTSLYCTDTVPQPARPQGGPIHVLSVAPLLHPRLQAPEVSG